MKRSLFGAHGVFVIRPDGTGLARVSDRAPWMAPGGRGAAGQTNRHAEANTHISWLPDGSAVAFATQDPDGALRVLVCTTDGLRQTAVLRTDDTIRSFAVAPDGRRLAVVITNGVTSRLVAVDLYNPSGAEHEIDLGEASRHAIYRYPKVVWGTRMILRLVDGGWSRHFCRDDDQMVALTPGGHEDGELVLAPSGDLALLSDRAHSATTERLSIIDLRNGARRPLDSLAPGFLMPVAWQAGRLYYTRATVNLRGDLYSCAEDGSDEVRLTASDEATDVLDVTSTEIAVSSGTDGEVIPALLYRPRLSAEPLPGIVWAHGGPVSPVSDGWATHAPWLAAHGFVVVVPAYRATAGLGVAHAYAGLGVGVGRADLDDIMAAGGWLADRADVDADRIAVAGRSWGGYLALRAVTSKTHPFRCAWASAGISDWEIQQAETEVRYYDLQLLDGFLTDTAVRARARSRSPIHDVAQISVPLLVTHGREDVDVPFRQIEAFVAAAVAAGTPIEATFYDHEGHENRIPENIHDECRRTVSFLRKHLVPWNLTDNPADRQVVY